MLTTLADASMLFNAHEAFKKNPSPHNRRQMVKAMASQDQKDRRSTPEFTVADNVVISDTESKGKGVYALNTFNAGDTIATYAPRLEDYLEPSVTPRKSIVIVGEVAQCTAEILGVDLSTYALDMMAKQPHRELYFNGLCRATRNLFQYDSNTRRGRITRRFKDNTCNVVFDDTARTERVKNTSILVEEKKNMVDVRKWSVEKERLINSIRKTNPDPRQFPGGKKLDTLFCSADFINYVNELVFFHQGWSTTPPVKPKWLDSPFFQMICVEPGIAEVVKNAIGYDIIPMERDEGNRTLNCPGTSIAARINKSNRTLHSNCEFKLRTDGIPGIIATRKIVPGEMIECNTYGNRYGNVDKTVTHDDTYKIIEKWLRSHTVYRREGYLLGLKMLILMTNTFSLDTNLVKKARAFFLKMMFSLKLTVPFALLQEAGIQVEQHPLAKGAMIRFKNSGEWWIAQVIEKRLTKKGFNFKMRLIRDDLCFEQIGFLNLIKTFYSYKKDSDSAKHKNHTLGRDFTSEIAPEGSTFKHIDEYQENDYCMLTSAITWDPEDTVLPEISTNKFSIWTAKLKTQLKVATECHKSLSDEEEQRRFVWNWLHAKDATLYQVLQCSPFEPFNTTNVLDNNPSEQVVASSNPKPPSKKEIEPDERLCQELSGRIFRYACDGLYYYMQVTGAGKYRPLERVVQPLANRKSGKWIRESAIIPLTELKKIQSNWKDVVKSTTYTSPDAFIKCICNFSNSTWHPKDGLNGLKEVDSNWILMKPIQTFTNAVASIRSTENEDTDDDDESNNAFNRMVKEEGNKVKVWEIIITRSNDAKGQYQVKTNGYYDKNKTKVKTTFNSFQCRDDAMIFGIKREINKRSKGYRSNSSLREFMDPLWNQKQSLSDQSFSLSDQLLLKNDHRELMDQTHQQQQQSDADDSTKKRKRDHRACSNDQHFFQEVGSWLVCQTCGFQQTLQPSFKQCISATAKHHYQQIEKESDTFFVCTWGCGAVIKKM